MHCIKKSIACSDYFKVPLRHFHLSLQLSFKTTKENVLYGFEPENSQKKWLFIQH